MDDKTMGRALREFQSYIAQPSFRGRYTAIYLRRIIREWLAHTDRRWRYQIASQPPHEVVSLIEFIDKSVRKGWKTKAKKTRAQTQKRKEVAKKAARQLTFRFN